MSTSHDQQELIVAAIKMFSDLGRPPTRDEMRKELRGFDRKVMSLFGGHTNLLSAAGIKEEIKPTRKIDQSIFERDLEKHLKEYRPRPQKILEPYKRCLFIPDTHFPFAHQPTLEKIYRFAEKHKPEIIVQMGDLYDAYSHTKFPRSHNVFTPKDEQSTGRKMAETMWKELQRAAPKAKCYQILGNHDQRPLKRILESYPEAETWIEKMIIDMMSFKNVETITDPRVELNLPGDVACTHGFKSQLGQHRDAFMKNVVTGHLHRGGVAFRQINGRVLWELNTGLAGDPESKGLSYTPSRISDSTLGWGWLTEYGPMFIHA